MRVAGVVVENEGESALVQIAQFDAMPRVEATALIAPCCASRRWAAEVVSGRPYGSVRRLITASYDVLADLRWDDVAEALAGHPRIGERRAGGDREATWSRAEQRDAAGSSVADALLLGNQAYEQRFGHVFLICATGRSPEQMLVALQQRLHNSTGTERDFVRVELREIVRLRLIKTFR